MGRRKRSGRVSEKTALRRTVDDIIREKVVRLDGSSPAWRLQSVAFLYGRGDLVWSGELRGFVLRPVRRVTQR